MKNYMSTKYIMLGPQSFMDCTQDKLLKKFLTSITSLCRRYTIWKRFMMLKLILHKHGKSIRCVRFLKSIYCAQYPWNHQWRSQKINLLDTTICKTIADNITYRSYVLWRGQFMTKQTKERRIKKAKKQFTGLKNPKQQKQLNFFSNEKNYHQDQNINRISNMWLCENDH